MGDLMPAPFNEHVKETCELLEKERATADGAMPARKERDAAEREIRQLTEKANYLLITPPKKAGCITTALLWILLINCYACLSTMIHPFCDWIGAPNKSHFAFALALLSFPALWFAARWILEIPERRRMERRHREAVLDIPPKIQQAKIRRDAADAELRSRYDASGSSLPLPQWDSRVIDDMIRLAREMQLPDLPAVLAEYRRRQELQEDRQRADASEQRRRDEAQQIIEGQENLSRQLDFTNLNIWLSNQQRNRR